MATIVSSLSLDSTKPISDKKNYRVIRLSNGIRALLIHEPVESSTTASVSLAVSGGAGSFHDPVYRQGLAHFCEHMVFMGSEKYPGENEYDSYLSKHGGNSNAFTELETTCYITEVQQSVLFETLDRFSYFFYKPLFAVSSVQREVRAVDSEFKQGTSDDDIVLSQIVSHSFSSSHPLASFAWGNRRSLCLTDSTDNCTDTVVPDNHTRTINIDSLITDLKDFYHQVYNTRYMHLVVQANGDILYSKYANDLSGCTTDKSIKGLDVLQYLVVNTFGRIPLTDNDSSLATSLSLPDYNNAPIITSPLLRSLISSSSSSSVDSVNYTILNPYQSLQYLQSINGIADRSILRGDQWYHRTSLKKTEATPTNDPNSGLSLQQLSHGGYAYGPMLTSTDLRSTDHYNSLRGTYIASPIDMFSLPSSSSSSFSPSFGSSSTPYVHFMAPSKNKHTLSLSWALPPLPNMYFHRPYEILGHIIGHEAKGSLLYILRQTGFLISLSAGVDDSGMDNNRISNLFSISMNCTSKGILHYKLIIQIIFSYIQYVLCNGINIAAIVSEGYQVSSLSQEKFMAPYSAVSPDITLNAKDAKQHYACLEQRIMEIALHYYPVTVSSPSSSTAAATPLYPDYSFLRSKFPSPFGASTVPSSVLGLSTFLGYTLPLPLLDKLYTNTLNYYGMQKEMAQVNRIAYQYQDEGDRIEIVEDLAYSMATLATADKDILLAANDIFGTAELLRNDTFPSSSSSGTVAESDSEDGFAPAMITFLLTHLVPQNLRIDILSPFVNDKIFINNSPDPIFHLPVRNGSLIDKEDNDIIDAEVPEPPNTDDEDENENGGGDNENEDDQDEETNESNGSSSFSRPIKQHHHHQNSGKASHDDDESGSSGTRSGSSGTDDEEDCDDDDGSDDDIEDEADPSGDNNDSESDTNILHALDNQLPSKILLTEWETKHIHRFTEPFWGRPYVQTPIDPETLHSWINPPNPGKIVEILRNLDTTNILSSFSSTLSDLLLHFPAENPYIPTDLSVKPVPSSQPEKTSTSTSSVTSPSPTSPDSAMESTMPKELTIVPHEITRIAYGLDPLLQEHLTKPIPNHTTSTNPADSSDPSLVTFNLVPLLHYEENANTGVFLSSDPANTATTASLVLPPSLPSSSSSSPTIPSVPIYSLIIGRCWHAQDTKYRLPRTHLHLFIHLPSLYTNIYHILYADIWYYIVKQYLNEDTYYAQLSNLNSSVSSSRLGCEIEISGFTDKVSVLLNKLIRTLTLTAYSTDASNSGGTVTDASSSVDLCELFQINEEKFYLIIEQRYRAMDNQYRSLASQSNSDYYRIMECDNVNLHTIYGINQEYMSYETRLEILHTSIQYAHQMHPSASPLPPSQDNISVPLSSSKHAPLKYNDFLQFIGLPMQTGTASTPFSSTGTQPCPSLWSSAVSTPIIMDILVHGNEDTTSANEHLRILHSAINPRISQWLSSVPLPLVSTYLSISNTLTKPPGTFRTPEKNSSEWIISLPYLYPRYPSLTIPTGTTIVRTFASRSNDEINGYTLYHIQAGYDSSSSSVLRTLLELLEDLLYEPFYDNLRTKQQLGYEVNVRKVCEEDNGALGLNFVVKSAEYSPMEVRKRIETFLTDYRTSLVKLCTCNNSNNTGNRGNKSNHYPHDETLSLRCPLDQRIHAILEQKLCDADGLEEDAWRHWIEIRGGRTRFQRLNEEVNILRSWLSYSSTVVTKDASTSPTTTTTNNGSASHQHYGHKVLVNFYDQIILHTHSSLMMEDKNDEENLYNNQRNSTKNNKNNGKSGSKVNKKSNTNTKSTGVVVPVPVMDDYHSGGGRLCIQVLGKQAKWYNDSLLPMNSPSVYSSKVGSTTKSMNSKKNSTDTVNTNSSDIMLNGPPNVISEWKQSTLGLLTLDPTTSSLTSAITAANISKVASSPSSVSVNSTNNNKYSNNPWKYSGPVYTRE